MIKKNITKKVLKGARVTGAPKAKKNTIKVIQPKVLYEDADILVVNKPAGLLTHGDGRAKVKTLSEWLVKKFPEAKTVGEMLTMSDGEDTDRSGIVHRLDKDTSGVILLAKTQAGFECLKEQFQNHEVKKIYHAFAVGIPRESRGVLDHPIGKSATDFRARSASFSARGDAREAVTHYIVKKTKKTPTGSYSFVQAMPKTGRTHQIRAHFKALGHPLIGDSLYGNTKNNLGFERTALHSFSIEFTNCEGDRIRVEAPYPADFTKALEDLSKE